GVTKQVGYSDVRNAVCVFEVTDQAGNHALERLAFENVIMTAGETTAVYYEAIPSPTVVGTLSFEKRQGSPASALTLKAEGDGSVTISAPADAVPGDYYYDVKVDGKNTRVSSFVQVTVLKKKEPVVITVTADDYYFEGFENDGVPEGWTFVDADGDGNGWFGSDSSKSAVRTGDWVLTSESSSEEQGLLQPDNWAFTPALRLPEGAMLSFWIRGEEYMYCEENLAVYAGFRPNPDDVTKIAGDCKSVGQYVEYVVDLSDYAGQTVYLGFRHYESCDQSSLNLDDVRVGVNPSVDLNVKIAKKSLRLQDTIAIDFKVSKESLTGYHDPYLCVSQGNCVTRLTDYYDDGTLLVYTYRVAPQMIVDEVAVVPHVLNAAGEDVRGETFNYSVVTYCQNMLGKAEYQTEKWAPFRRLLVDILRYGDASQLYVTYRPFDLPSYRLTAEQLANGTDVGAEMHYDSVKEPNFAEVDEKDARATIATASLYLEAAVNVRYKIEASDVTNLRLVVTDGTNVLEDLQLDPNKKDENGRFYADLDCLNAGEMKKTVYATVMDGNKKVSNTYRYSIESYAASMKGKHGALLDNLIDAMMRYGNSVADYVESMK
ncbi:MAG: choice-of-anchor J domain-containing protein, partial [Lachnospiraceae bacterium]|nr:choice-of-anchor J domain-containing protein [Lachnospiraceae bacterium]